MAPNLKRIFLQGKIEGCDLWSIDQTINLVGHRCFSAQLELGVSRQQIYAHPSDLPSPLRVAYLFAEFPHPLKL